MKEIRKLIHFVRPYWKLAVLSLVLLTLMVFSYILGDNVLFKLATHIFVGVAVGYAAAICNQYGINICYNSSKNPGKNSL